MTQSYFESLRHPGLNLWSGKYRVTTLGPALTCSYLAAEEFRKTFDYEPDLRLAPTFDECRDLLLKGKADILLAPVLHPMGQALILDERFKVWDDYAFWKWNPPLYLASNHSPLKFLRSSSPLTCSSLLTLQPLLKNLTVVKFLKDADDLKLSCLDVDSTYIGAKMVNTGDACTCITNELSLKEFNLTPWIELYRFKMNWAPVTLSTFKPKIVTKYRGEKHGQ